MTTPRESIRFGIMCNGTTFPAWQVKAIKKLLDHPQIELGLLILDQRKATSAGLSTWEKVKQLPVRQLFWKIYQTFYVKKVAAAYRQEDLSDGMENTPKVHCQVVKKGKFSEYFASEDIATIKSHRLDFILRFGFGIIRGDVLTAARYGVWSFHHGDEETYRGTPPCFWEIYHQERVTGSILQRLTNRLDGGIVLKKGFFKTKYTYPGNVNQAFFASADWPRQSAIDILNGHLDKVEGAPSSTHAPIYFVPTNTQLLRYFTVAAWLQVQKAFKSLLYVDYWNIGVAEIPIQSFLQLTAPPPVKWFPNRTKRKFLADPFAVFEQGRLTILYETFRYREKIGKIEAAEYRDGAFLEQGIILNEDFHLSYPFMFDYNGQRYCIPETYQANQVRLYRAVEFPHRWAFDRVLIDQYAGVDMTLLHYNKLWWMFSTDKNDGVHHHLRLFFAENPLGKWQPHPQNPVKTDIRAARPAGTLFFADGDMYRPAMDYSEKIEGRIVINKVLKLSPTEYEEEEYTILNPLPDTYYSDKIHTLCEAGPYTILDGARELFIFSDLEVFQYKLQQVFKKLRKAVAL